MHKVLIVDDDPDVLEYVRLCLTPQGYEVLTAENPQQGFSILQNQNPDLLILDIIMEQPDDGIAMAQDLRAQGYQQPILILSSISKVMGFQYGKDNELLPVNDFLEKPIKPEDLLTKVNMWLSSAKNNLGGEKLC